MKRHEDNEKGAGFPGASAGIAAKHGALLGTMIALLSASLVGAGGEAVIQVQGVATKIPLSPGEAGPNGRIEHVTWGSPEQQKRALVASFSTKDSKWQKGTLTFTPEKTGRIEVKLGVPASTGGNNKYVLYDSADIRGAEFENPDFEKGAEAGWTMGWREFPGRVVEDARQAQAGSFFALTWKNHRVAQYLEVEEDELVTITLMYRVPTDAEGRALRDPSRSRPARGMAPMAETKGRRFREIIKDKYPGGNVWVSVATGWDRMNSTEYHIVKEEFTDISPFNFAQHTINPVPGKWKWEIPDAWIDHIEKTGQFIRLHSPISPQCGKWSKTDSRTGEELDGKMTKFMTELCRRYNGRKNVKWLEVANETVGPQGEWMKDRPGAHAWETPWVKMGYTRVPAKYKHLNGQIPTYIVKAFKIATKEAPSMRLIINQHKGMEEPMWNVIKDMVAYLRSIGCRVDGLGWQAHIKMGSAFKPWETSKVDLDKLSELVRWAHANDLDFLVTENDIIYAENDKETLQEKEKDHEEHIEIYTGIFQAVMQHYRTGVVGVSFWTPIDKDGHNRKNEVAIGLWDRNYQPKELYYEIQSILENLDG